MNTCGIFYLALGMLILGDAVIFLNVHRLVKAPAEDAALPAGRTSPRERQIMVIRLAVAMSVLAALAVFGYLLSRQGCLG